MGSEAERSGAGPPAAVGLSIRMVCSCSKPARTAYRQVSSSSMSPASRSSALPATLSSRYPPGRSAWCALAHSRPRKASAHHWQVGYLRCDWVGSSAYSSRGGEGHALYIFAYTPVHTGTGAAAPSPRSSLGANCQRAAAHRSRGESSILGAGAHQVDARAALARRGHPRQPRQPLMRLRARLAANVRPHSSRHCPEQPAAPPATRV
eukprot:scaffold6811_cov126-Isochrysis_galbana.AAC.3